MYINTNIDPYFDFECFVDGTGTIIYQWTKSLVFRYLNVW